MSELSPYQLAFQLHGHASDVRTLCAPSPDIPLLISGSRDGSALLWGPGRSGDWDVKMRVEAPEKKYVSCVGMTKWQGEAFLLVGSSSGILSTYTLPSATSNPPPEGQMQEPYHTLIEHKQNLCCMDVSKNNLIATGSWDQSVIIWKDFKKVIKIEGHKQAVWAVKFIGEDRLLTASADKTIVLHQLDLAKGTSKPLQTYTGHTEPVRGLSLQPGGKGFWSCGNDGLVNVYSLDKLEPKVSLSGHSSFVYSVVAFPDGSGAISTGEDGTMRVWSNTELIQTIPHSSNSIWSSAIVPGLSGPNAYIASSANDATIRFFTRDNGLRAPQAEREEWDKQVSSRALDKSQVGDVKHSDLPGMEALGREGKQDGQVIMIKNNDQVEAYQWSTSASTWQQIGQVVDAIGSGRKQLYEGKEYDYVFDVDVQEGVPPLKLPYNISDNPFMAAQNFLTKNELPSSYLDQVVEFIHKNTDGASSTIGQESNNTYVDPYTGSSRYTGSSSSAPQSQGGSDPFTGGSAYSSTPSAPPAPKSTNILPVKNYLSFKQINLQAVQTKISQFAEEFKSEGVRLATQYGADGQPALALSDDEKKNLDQIYEVLTSPSIVANKPTSERFDPVQFCLLFQKWPEEKRFPLLDLARILATVSPSFGATCTPDALLTACDWSLPYTSSKVKDTNTLLALRTFANLFTTPTGRKNMTGMKVDEWLSALRRERSWEEVGGRKLPFTTIVLNFSILAVHGEYTTEHINPLTALIVHILKNETKDSETIYRASIALGNLLSSKSVSGSLRGSDINTARALVSERAKSLGEKRLTDLAKEIEGLGQV